MILKAPEPSKTGFKKPLLTVLKNPQNTVCLSSSRKTVHVATNGFQKPFHNSNKQLLIKSSKIVRVIMEAC
jgi:hypothetical protein